MGADLPGRPGEHVAQWRSAADAALWSRALCASLLALRLTSDLVWILLIRQRLYRRTSYDRSYICGCVTAGGRACYCLME